MQNILFIGGAGFIGSNIIKSLQDRDIHISVLEPPFADIHRLDALPIRLFRGELQNIDYIRSIVETNNIKTVVHLVSTIIPGSSFEDYKREYQNVIFPSIELMQLCAQKGIKFVYFSSGGTVYGNRDTKEPFVETDPMAPISYYGWSKQMMENSIHYVHRTSGLEYLILRPSNPYGHGQKLHAQQGLIAVAIGKILNGEAITVWGDGSSVRDYIYIDDLAGIVRELLLKDVCNRTLNIGSNEGYSINDIISLLKDIVEEPVKVDYVTSREVDVANMILDTTELKKIVDIPILPLKEGISLFYHEVKQSIMNSGETRREGWHS